MKNFKIDGTKALTGLGLLMTLIGSIASSVANDRKLKDVVNKVVDEKLKNI